MRCSWSFGEVSVILRARNFPFSFSRNKAGAIVWNAWSYITGGTTCNWNTSHSIGFSGEGPLPFSISLKLCRYPSILGHQLQRPSDLRMTHAQYSPPDP